MPHTNNAYASDRKANRARRKPAFLSKRPTSNKPSPADPDLAVDVDPATVPKGRADKTALIRAYHAIEKQLASPALTDPDERKKLVKKQEELGGLAAYQAASVHGGDKSRGGESSKWLIKQIKELKIGLEDKGKGKEKEKVEPTIVDGKKVWPKIERRKLRLLDVGAIAGTAYADWPWISTVSIDLNPQAPHVLPYNFFDYPVPETDDDKFDVVALSLVMNFEGSLVNRGHMLLHAHSYLRPSASLGGYLYIVLPLPCLTNSRYLSHDHFRSILASTGWDVIKQHDSAKLTYWLVRQREADAEGKRGDGKVWKREEVRAGVHRNNFTVRVEPGEPVERGTRKEKEDKEEAKQKEEAEGKAVEPIAAAKDEAKDEEEEEEEEWGGIDI
ncbi:hypothetical protein JCM1840_001811 [Sporobolomyces johnsonii]